MPDPTLEESLALFRRGLDLALQGVASQYVLPMCWITSKNGRPAILGSGSAFVMDAGDGPFGVSAVHVFAEYSAALAERADTVCLLHDLKIPLNERLRSYDPLYDVATFNVSPAEIAFLRRQGKVVLTGSQSSWPPAPPQLGRGVFFVGFPGDGRHMLPYRGGGLVEVQWEGYTALAIATSISETGITVHLEHQPEYDIGRRRRVPPDWALGGCSGAPLLTLVDHLGIYSWRLGGVIYESSETIIKASRADAINADGTLNAYPDPNAYITRERRR
jgi:hypothetical protein